MTGAILQVRTGSSRLPGKALLPLRGMPMLAYILRRLRAGLPDLPVIVATTVLRRDDALVALCEDEGFRWFRGSETDVLERYYECALKFGLAHIVRLTADNPFVDLKELDRLMRLHLRSNCDYTHSFNSLPVGTGAEIFTLPCLSRVFHEGHAAHHREHVNEYILENPGNFKILELDVNPGKHRPELRLTVDTSADYEIACRIVAGIECHWVQAEDAIAWLSQSA